MANLKRNIGITFTGNVVYAMSQWALVIILAKLAGEATLGVYTLALAVVSPVFAFSNMNLRSVQATDAARPVSYDSYARFRHWSSLVSIVACFLCATLFYRNDADVLLAIVSLAFYKYFESKSDLAHGLFQRHEHMHLMARSLMIRGVGNALVVGFGFMLTESLTAALLAATVKSWVISRFIDHRNIRHLPADTDQDEQSPWQIFRLAWPLGIVVFANTLNLNIPRFFLADTMGNAALGVFASISYFIVAGATLVNAIGLSATPRLARLAAQPGMPGFRGLAYRVVVLIGAVGLAGVAVSLVMGEWLLQLVYTPAIAAEHALFARIMWAGVAVYVSTSFGCSLTALRDFRVQGVLSVINVVVMCALSWVLIGEYGMVGAAMAIASTYIVKAALAWGRLEWLLVGRRQ